MLIDLLSLISEFTIESLKLCNLLLTMLSLTLNLKNHNPKQFTYFSNGNSRFFPLDLIYQSYEREMCIV